MITPDTAATIPDQAAISKSSSSTITAGTGCEGGLAGAVAGTGPSDGGGPSVGKGGFDIFLETFAQPRCCSPRPPLATSKPSARSVIPRRQNHRCFWVGPTSRGCISELAILPG